MADFLLLFCTWPEKGPAGAVVIGRTLHRLPHGRITHPITLIQQAVTLYFAIVNTYIHLAGVRTGYGNKR
jgi:hypothetical protein